MNLRFIVTLVAAVFFVFPLGQVQGYMLDPNTIVTLTNQERMRYGLPALQVNQRLSDAALKKAYDIASKGRLEHTIGKPGMPWSFIAQAGYVYKEAGENLAVHPATEEELLEGWMKSTSHRKNILNPKFTHMGIGVVSFPYAGVDSVYIVQYLASPQSTPAPLIAGTVDQADPEIAELQAMISQLLALVNMYTKQLQALTMNR